MPTSDIFFIIASICLIVIAVFLVPALMQLKKTAEKAEVTLQTLNNDLEPLMLRLTEVSEELQSLTSAINDKIERTGAIVDTVQLAGDNLLSTTDYLKKNLTPIIAQIGGIGAGISAFTNFFKKNKPTERRYFDE